MPTIAVRESRERVRAAIKNCGYDLSPKSVITNFAPADLRKGGYHLDLAIASLPSRGFRQDLPLFAKATVLPPQTGQLITLGTRQTIFATALVSGAGTRMNKRIYFVASRNSLSLR